MKVLKKQEKDKIKSSEDISRRKAMSKIGLITFSTATMLLLLNQPGKAQGGSPTEEDPGDGDTWPPGG